MKHSVGLVALTALLVLCLFLPFLPGRYDGLAVIVSGMVQALGFAGMLLVPLGAAWLVHEARRRTPRERPASATDKGYSFAIASVCVSALVVAFVALGAFVSGSLTLGLGTLALSAYGIARMARRLGGLKHAQDRTLSPAPAYLVLVPVAVLSARFLFLEPAVESSRNRAIRNSAELITEIEAYRVERGHYPPSLAALWKDYDPGVIGVEQYEYEPRGSAYSVFFEQPAVPLGTQEIVMYNKLDEHALPSHDSDILRWTPEELVARPGHYALHDASSPHWKYFWFD